MPVDQPPSCVCQQSSIVIQVSGASVQLGAEVRGLAIAPPSQANLNPLR